jgi:cobalt/nickel transport system permease protein
MHISDGVLNAPQLAAGAALAVGGLALGLRKIDFDRLPQVAILSAAFFVASLINIPIGPTRAHLVLNGLMGIMLGWATFPAMLVALTLQAVLFQFGGLTTLGVNTLNMALPAVACWLLFGKMARSASPKLQVLAGFLAGSLAVLGSALLVALNLALVGEEFLNVARLVVVVHLPVMIIEGLVTAATVGFIRRVRPAMLGIQQL